MNKVKMFVDLILLIIIVDGTYSDKQCDCTSLSDRQEHIMIRLSKLESDNYKMNKRLKRLRVSKGSKRTKDEIVTKAPKQKADHSVLKDIATNNTKRINTIEYTLTKVMTILKLSAPKTVKSEDKAQTNGKNNRLEQIESELLKVNKKMEQLMHTNTLRKDKVFRYDNILKRTITKEKNSRLNFELRVETLANNVNDVCRNFTKETGKVIDIFKTDILQKHEQFKEEMNSEAIKMNRSLNEHIDEIDIRFDNLQKEITDTKESLSSLETTAVKESTEQSPETTRNPDTTKVPVPAKKQPLLDRQLVCTNINVDGDILSYSGNGDVGLYVFNSTWKDGDVFEIEILSIGEEASMALGFVREDRTDNILPGLQSHTAGYHSDGKVYYRGNDRGKRGEKWTVGDKIECRLTWSMGSVLVRLEFSHNGNEIFRSGTFYWDVNNHFAVGMNGTQNKVKVILDS